MIVYPAAKSPQTSPFKTRLNTDLTDMVSHTCDGEARLTNNSINKHGSFCLYTSVSPRSSTEVIHCVRKSRGAVYEKTSNGSGMSLTTDGDHKAHISLFTKGSSASEIFQGSKGSSPGTLEIVPLQELTLKSHPSDKGTFSGKNSRIRKLSDNRYN